MHRQAIKLFKINCQKQLLVSNNDYAASGLLSEHWFEMHQMCGALLDAHKAQISQR